jgi:glycosyltransferase involved in cell wall biosynthesis
MKILYDHQIFYRQNYGGVSRYFCELMNQFSTDPDIRFILPLRYVQNDNLTQFPQLNKYWSGRYNKLYSNYFVSSLQKKIRFNALNFGLNFLINNQGEATRLLQKQDFDIFHPTYYEPYFLKYLRKKPFVLTVHDMIHELFPDNFSSRDRTIEWKKKLIENAGAIIAVSENTKQDIIKFTSVDPDYIHVIYHGSPFEHISIPSRIDPRFFEKSYLLFVGNRSGYKNFVFFIESIAGILYNHEDLHVVCAGSLPFTNEEKHFLTNLNLLNQVHHIKINDTILKNLYENARAFIFPSLYEGFGLPVLEAFSCGCPVLLSNSSSLPEVGGEGAIYFDPYDSASLTDALENLISDDYLRKQLALKGCERLKLFSWQKTANETKSVYENLINQ